jgi:hypothetical protein
VEEPEGRRQLGRDLREGGRIILKWILEKWDEGGKDWIDLAQDRDR